MFSTLALECARSAQVWTGGGSGLFPDRNESKSNKYFCLPLGLPHTCTERPASGYISKGLSLTHSLKGVKADTVCLFPTPLLKCKH